MEERRQVARREPIVVETSQGDIIAKPLPWMTRNDVGDLIIKTYVDSINAMVGAIQPDEDTGRVTGSGSFDDKAFNWQGVIDLAFDGQDLSELDIFELRACVIAVLDINGLEHLAHMIDPNVVPRSQAGDDQSDGAKTTSSDGSGSPVMSVVKSSS